MLYYKHSSLGVRCWGNTYFQFCKLPLDIPTYYTRERQVNVKTVWFIFRTIDIPLAFLYSENIGCWVWYSSSGLKYGLFWIFLYIFCCFSFCFTQNNIIEKDCRVFRLCVYEIVVGMNLFLPPHPPSSLKCFFSALHPCIYF